MENKKSLLARIFKPSTEKLKGNFNDSVTMVGYEPNFTKFGTQVLYSNLVLSALRMKARFFGKLEPRHVRIEGGKTLTVTDSTIAKVLRNPNHYQTTYDFLTQAFFMRERDSTCYIFNDRYKTKGGYWYHTGLYVLTPSDKPQVKEDAQGNLYLLFKFDGYDEEIPFAFDEIIVWKKDNEDNQYMGGGKFSGNAKADLLNSLNAYHEITETVAEAAKLGCMFEGYIKVNAYTADDEQNKKYRDKFVDDIRNNKGKPPVLDNTSDYIELKRQLKMVDATTLAEIKQNVVIDTGVSLDMLQGKFTPEDKEAFYENWIEPAAVSLGQAMEKVMFSRSADRIILYPHKVQLMATSEIVSIIQSTIAAGVFKIDEYREMLGYAPLENGEGEQRPRGFNELDGGAQSNAEEVTQ